jgi:hypothetical protein
MTKLREMVELSGAELDAVSGGERGQGGGLGLGGAAGLVAVAAGVGAGVGIGNIDVDVIDDVVIQDLLNSNDIAIGVAANLLGTSVQALRALQ